MVIDNNKKEKIIGVFLIIIIVLAILIMAYIGYKIFNTDNDDSTVAEEETTIGGNSSKSNTTLNAISAISSSSSSTEKKYMEDYEIIGELEIPAIDLTTNILAETTKRSLEIAVAQIYTTGGLNEPGNTVIYGHNYRNSLFFSRNDELEIGDKVIITDSDDDEIIYEIYDIFETTSTDTSFYSRTAEDTVGKCEVTLSTCTDDASTTDRRLIVLAREAE